MELPSILDFVSIFSQIKQQESLQFAKEKLKQNECIIDVVRFCCGCSRRAAPCFWNIDARLYEADVFQQPNCGRYA
jgi:hypothetical protein